MGVPINDRARQARAVLKERANLANNNSASGHMPGPNAYKLRSQAALSDAKAKKASSSKSKEEPVDLSDIDPQYLLLTNLWDFSDHWRSVQDTRSEGYSYTVLDDSQNAQITANSLLGIPEAESFLEIDQKYISSLRPSVRLFKGDGDTEIRFNNFTDLSDLTEGRAGRGAGSGLKSLHVDMLGDSIASADRMYSVKVELFLSSMEELFRERTGYSYSDLISKPPMPTTTTGNPCQDVPDSFSAKNLSVRLEFGYADFSGSKLWKSADDDVKNAVRRCKRVMKLNLYKHTVDFRENGSLILNIEYHGYIERSAANVDVLELGMSKEDRRVLAEYELKRCEENESEKHRSPSEKPKEEQKLAEESKKTIDALDRKIKQKRKEGYSSFIYKLLKGRRIHRLQIHEDDIDLNTAKIKKSITVLSNSATDSNKTANARARQNAKKRTNPGLKKDIRRKDGTIGVDYFYFGDLLDYIIELASEKGEFKNVNFVLGTFNHMRGNKLVGLPIASLPVAMDTFAAWFMENVIKKGERSQFSLMDFLVEILRSLLAPTFMSPPPRKMKNVKDSKYRAPVFEASTVETSEMLPKMVISSSKIKKNIINPHITSSNIVSNYYIHGDSTSLKSSLKPLSREEDAEHGIFHLVSGTDSGLVKRVKFTQQESALASAVRMRSHGVDSMQSVMWSMYNATVDLVGCPIFKPGMQVKISSSNFEQSNADKIGLGGYYLITKVHNSVKEGAYSTELECLWQRPGS